VYNEFNAVKIARFKMVDIKEKFGEALDVVDVYFTAVPETVSFMPLVPIERNHEIERVSNERVRAEKYCVWKLLEYALYKSFGYKMSDLTFVRTENGKWICDKCEFSLSHCEGATAVAVANSPVGVDIETTRRLSRERFANRILTKSESTVYEKLADEEKERFLLGIWTKKESIFKREGGKSLSPSSIETLEAKLYHGYVELSDKEYVFSVATDTPEAVRIYSNVEIFK